MNDLYSTEEYTHKNGKKYIVQWYFDHDYGSPLEHDDSHGQTERLDWNPTDEEQLEQHLYDYEPELEEETRLRMIRVLCRASNRFDSGLYYDVMSSLEIARKDWGITDPVKAMEAVEADFKHLKGWYDDEWFWLTLRVTATDESGNACKDSDEYLCGIESKVLTEGETQWRTELIDESIAHLEYMLYEKRHADQLRLNFASLDTQPT